MIRKDIVLRWTQELAKVIAKILGKETQEALNIIEEAYKELLFLDPKVFDQLPNDQILDFLIQEKQLNIEQLTFFAGLLAKEGELLHQIGEFTIARNKLEKALIIFDHIERHHELFSFDRQNTINTIKNLLNQ